MKYGRIIENINIPEDVSIGLDGKQITVKGKLGSLSRSFNYSDLEMQISDESLKLISYFPRKKDKALIGTITAHINNMIVGTTTGYKYMLKIVYSHFPIRVTPELKKNRVKVENLYGGRKPKYSKILSGVKVAVDNEDIIVEGIDIEAVGQTSANLQELTRQRGKRRKSPKTFMDGIYLFYREHQKS